MIASSGIAEHASIRNAVRNAFRNASDHLRCPVHCVFLFVSGDDLGDQADAILAVMQELAPRVPVFGCSAESIVGRGREIEGQTAASILLIGELSQAPTIFHMECMRTPDGPTVVGITNEHVERAHQCNGMLIAGCPMSFSVDMLVDALEPERGEKVVPILGGYCSSKSWESSSLLFCGDQVVNRGAVGLVLPPELHWQTIVSQGCRPIGEPMVITSLDSNTIVGLGGRPALVMLREMFQRLPNHERDMAIDALLIGRAITEYSETFSHGDFLIRNVQGVDTDTNGILVTDRFHVGQTIRFHVRDAQGADADLANLLSRVRRGGVDNKAGLLFSCNGRGSRMFTQPNHDALAIDKEFPGLPLSGIFAAGEFAPLANRNLMHGFTAVCAFLRESLNR